MSAAPSQPASDPWGYLFAPASCYPTPTAYAIDSAGAILHAWSHPACQPPITDNPPSYLRGWNHVQTDPAGNLLAIVPLRALLKLDHDSRLQWAAAIAAHHDLAIADDGSIHVLTETPRYVRTSQSRHVVLDNIITTLDLAGAIVRQMSLYDILRTNDHLRRLIDDTTIRRAHAFAELGWPTSADHISDSVATQTLTLLRTGRHHGPRRRALQLLRALPGSPCDILHTNTLELLDAHPTGLWLRGDVLVCMRELDIIAVLDLVAGAVKWWWGGPHQLSGPHQPTMLPNGQILIFDNGRAHGRSRLVAVDPATGSIEWTWTAQPPESFFCPLAGGCEPLPNGDLLVTDSTAGAAFRLTRDGDLAWRLDLPAAVFGHQRGRVSIYRMSAISQALPGGGIS